jgi:sialic acid synthase SpsE
VAKRAIRAGSVIREDDLTYKRPGTGISPLHWDEVIGKKARIDIEEDRIMQFSDIDV